MTVRWPWQRRLDAKRKREADSAARRQEKLKRDQELAQMDPATPCECGHPLNAHPRNVSMLGLMPRSCGATVTRRRDDGDDAWPCGCREFKEVAA